MELDRYRQVQNAGGNHRKLFVLNLVFPRHWQSISLRCQPCRFVYDYILDIQTAVEDSEYVFGQLNFNTGLPSFHSSSKSSKRPLEDYYRNIPKDLIKKVYSKYYLDFVLFGFSPVSVRRILEAGTDEPSNYSFKCNLNASFEQYSICNDPSQIFDNWFRFNCARSQKQYNDIAPDYLRMKPNFPMNSENIARQCWNLPPFLFQN